MESPTRADLEHAAQQFFARLRDGLDQPRHFHDDFMELEVAQAMETSRDKIEELDEQLIRNEFGGTVSQAADEMLSGSGINVQELEPRLQIAARQLAARALREQWRLYVHQLSNPGSSFEADALFVAAPALVPPMPSMACETPPRSMMPGQTLASAVTDYLAAKRPTVGQSQLAEVARALGWLEEVLGKEIALAAIGKEALRGFRDDLTRIKVGLRGRKLPFRERLTNQIDQQILSQTFLRYWKSVQAFFRWCNSEGLRDDDPAATLVLKARKQDQAHSPEPFSEPELRKLFATPIFTGFKAPKSFTMAGDCHHRGGHWWFPVLALHSGMRAGEISQLLPEDFVFDAEIPHVRVREEDASGKRVKQAKSAAAIRDIPVHPNLIALGLQAFVAAQKKGSPKGRVFRAFNLGTGDRISDGATRFWRKYFKQYGLHKQGRSTHVFRHTFAAALRNAGASDEDVGAILGHAAKTVTAGYGGGQSLARKAKTLALLDYAFDVVEALGGPSAIAG
jgi:integrase